MTTYSNLIKNPAFENLLNILSDLEAAWDEADANGDWEQADLLSAEIAEVEYEIGCWEHEAGLHDV